MSEPPQQCPLCDAELLVDEEYMYRHFAEAYPDFIPWQQWAFYCAGEEEHVFEWGQITQHLPPETVQTMTPARRALFQEVATKVAQGKGKLKMTPEATQAFLDYLIELERIAISITDIRLHEETSAAKMQLLRTRVEKLPISHLTTKSYCA